MWSNHLSVCNSCWKIDVFHNLKLFPWPLHLFASWQMQTKVIWTKISIGEENDQHINNAKHQRISYVVHEVLDQVREQIQRPS